MAGERSSSLRIGFVGSGAIAWAHALALRSLIRAQVIDAELAVVHDRDPARSAEMAERLHMEQADSPEALVQRCDAVYVCTSTAGHLETVRKAAAAGRALFCEKPLGRSLAEATALAEIVGGAGVLAQVGLVLRSAPVYLELAALAASGELGRCMAATMRDDQFFPVQGHYASSWRKDVAEAGSGTLLEHAIHDVDIARMCFGRVSSVSGQTRNLAGHEGIEDCAAGWLSFESGMVVTMLSAWHWVLSRPSTRRVEAVFERGFVHFEDDFTGPITVETSERATTRRCDPPGYVDSVELPPGRVGIGVRPYVEENKRFVEAVTTGIAPRPGIEEALAAHRVVDAWYRSAAEGGAPIGGPF